MKKPVTFPPRIPRRRRDLYQFTSGDDYVAVTRDVRRAMHRMRYRQELDPRPELRLRDLQNDGPGPTYNMAILGDPPIWKSALGERLIAEHAARRQKSKRGAA